MAKKTHDPKKDHPGVTCPIRPRWVASMLAIHPDSLKLKRYEGCPGVKEELDKIRRENEGE